MGHDSSNRSRRSFSDEFKRDAVALVRETGRPITHVADELGLYDSTLGNWVRAAEATEADGTGLDVDERAELEAVKRELAEVKMERDLLKRMTAFWVKESTP